MLILLVYRIKKISYDLAKEMHLEKKASGKKNTRDRTPKKIT